MERINKYYQKWFLKWRDTSTVVNSIEIFRGKKNYNKIRLKLFMDKKSINSVRTRYSLI